MKPEDIPQPQLPISITSKMGKRRFLTLAPYFAQALRENVELSPKALGMAPASLMHYLVQSRAGFNRFTWKNEWLTAADKPRLRALKFHFLANGNIRIDRVDGRVLWRQKQKEETIRDRIAVLDRQPVALLQAQPALTVNWEDEPARLAALERAQNEPAWADSSRLSFLANANHLAEAEQHVKKIWPLSVRAGNRIVVVV